MNAERKDAAWHRIVKAFCEWFTEQPIDTQREIMLHAKSKHGCAPKIGTLIDQLCHMADSEEQPARLSAKVLLYLTATLAKPDSPSGTAYSLPNPPKDRLTAQEAAAVLGMSRADLFRKLRSSPALREFLGYTGTNTRNGRYSLERCLDYHLQGLPVFRPRHLDSHKP